MATAKPAYKFFVSNGRPQPADRRMRSHAIKTALRMRVKDTDAEDGVSSTISPANSDLTFRSRAQLKGRFRIAPVPEPKVTSSRGVPDDVVENPLSVSATRMSGDDAALAEHLDHRLAVLSIESGNWAISVLQDQQTIPDSIRQDWLDPFDSIPVQNNWRVDFLIKHCMIESTPKLYDHNLRSWFAYALTDPLIMHTTLALSGVDWLSGELITDPRLKQEVVHQKLEGIKTVMSHIEGPKVIDTIIAGVATLANTACFEGSFGEADMHMRAIRQMIEARGGLETFRGNFLVSRAVTWVDLQTASALGRAPYFSSMHGAHQLCLPSAVQEIVSGIQLDHVEQISGDAQIVEIFLILRKVILTREHHPDPNIIRILMNLADEKILSGLARSSVKEFQHSFKVALLLGAHLFLYAALRQVPPTGLLLQTLLARLERHLKGLTFNPESKDQLYVWLWLLFVGMLVESTGRVSVPRIFTVRLEVFCHAHAILDVDTITHVLKMFLWLDSTCLQSVMEFFTRFIPSEGAAVS